MSRLLANASSRRKVRWWRTASGVRAGAQSSKKKHCKPEPWSRSEALGGRQTHASEFTSVREIAPLRRAYGIQFP
jgi:hypothetical protein